MSFSLLICTLRSDLEGGRKVVLQTRIFFLVGDQEKKVGLLLNHLFSGSATLKITSKAADKKVE